jgi:general secretion pathway protein M
MMAQLTKAWRAYPWVRRAAFVAANLAAGMALLVLLVMPVRGFFAERDDRIVAQRDLLARLNAVAAQAAQVEAAARQTDAQIEQGEFLTGTNEGVIVADLQTRLKAVAEAAGARLRSVQSLPPKSKDDVRYVGARLDAFGPVEAIQRAIYAVETGKPYLFVGAAVIRAAPPVNTQGLAHVAAPAPAIDAQLDIFGAVQLKGRDP